MNSCPNCDAPAQPGARVCSTCGYRFLEDRRPGRTLLAAAAVAALVAAAVIVYREEMTLGRRRREGARAGPPACAHRAALGAPALRA